MDPAFSWRRLGNRNNKNLGGMVILAGDDYIQGRGVMMDNTPKREMSLEEYMQKLPDQHRAYKEYVQLLSNVDRKINTIIKALEFIKAGLYIFSRKELEYGLNDKEE